MTNTWKRFLSLALAIVMVLSCAPMPAFASATTPCEQHDYVEGVCSACGATQPVATETPETEAPETEAPTGAPVASIADSDDGEKEPKAAVQYSLVGFINGANHGIEEDLKNPGDHIFVDGKLTVDFTQISFVYVKTTDNETHYMTDGLQEGATSVTLHDSLILGTKSDKLIVPAGTHDFTLRENDDGTLTLSYGGEEEPAPSEPECTHEYAYNCSTACKLCGEAEREASHNFGENEQNCTYGCGTANPNYVEVITGTITENMVWEDGAVIGGVTIAGDVTITVQGTVTVNGTIRLSPDAICNVVFNGENGAKLIRGNEFAGQMFYAEGASGNFQNLTFNNITLDGGAVWTGDVDKILNRGKTNEGVQATGSVLYLVYANADLNNSVLQNHDDYKGEKANAVFLRYYSTIDFNNSVVRNNNSNSTYYRGGVITVRQGGTATTNKTEVYGNSGPSGGFFGISSTGSFGGVAEVKDSKFYNNYSDNGAVFLMQCNSNKGYLKIDGCEFYNNASKTAVLTEWAYSRPFIISNSSFHDNECAVWDCNADPVLDISGKIVITEDPDYTKYLFETPLVLSGPLAEDSSIAMSEATLKKLGGTFITGTADYAVSEADLAKFGLPEGYEVYLADVNGDGLADVVTSNEAQTEVKLTLKDSANAEASEEATVYSGIACLPVNPFSHDGMVFNGWVDAEGNAVAKQKFTAAATLTATWKLEAPAVKLSRENATLKATVTNETEGITYTYQWYMDNAVIENATAATYIMTDANSHSYKCVVTASKDGFVAATGSASGNASAPAVAQVGDVKCTSLSAAIAAAQAGDTITLLADVTLGEKLTISKDTTISGAYTITRADNYTGTLFTVNAGATLTLDGGLTIDGNNEWVFDAEGYNAALEANDGTEYSGFAFVTSEAGAPVATAKMIVVNGALVMNAATIQNHMGKNSCGVAGINAGGSMTLNDGATFKHNATSHSSVVANLAAGATVTINDGALITDNYYAKNGGIFQSAGYIEMNGGEISHNFGVNTNGTAAMMATNNAKFVMNDGLICSNSSVRGSGAGRNAAIYLHSTGIFEMNGGSICHNIGCGYGGIDTNQTNNSYLTITGGYVGKNVSKNGNSTADINMYDNTVITGGTFTQNVSQWLAPGCGLAYNEETGTYGVATEGLYKLHLIDPATNEPPFIPYIEGNDLASLVETGKAFYGNYYKMELEVLYDTKIDKTVVIDYPMTVNLNGKTTTAAAGVDPMFRIESDVVFTGSGKVDARNGEAYAFILGKTDGTEGNLTINGDATYYGETTVASVTNGTLTINGGKFAVNPYEGSYEYTLNCIDANYKAGTANVVVNGGVFYKFNPANNAAEGAGTNFLTESSISEELSAGFFTVRAVNYVAQIGEQKFESLQEAVNVGGEVTLLKDIELSTTVKVKGTVVLNLNGKTITGTDNATGSFALIEVQPDADLTVNGDGKITLTATNNRGWGAYSSVISNQRGKLTVNGGTIEHLGGTDMAYAIDNLTNTGAQKAETVINGGTIKSTYRAIRQFLNSTTGKNILTVNGGTIEGANRAIWMQDANTSANPGALTVSENATLNGDVYLTVTAGSTAWPVEVAVAASAVNGEVLTTNVPEGYKLQNVNGTIGVVNAVVEMNGVYYASIYDALNVVQPRETATIKILQDFVITADQRMFSNYSIVINAEYITLDLNGKTITFDYTGNTQTCHASIAIYNKGTLKIIDSSEEKTGTLYNKCDLGPEKGPRIIWVTTAGNVTIEGGNFISEQSHTMFYASNSNMEIPTTLYIKDGYFEHTVITEGGKYRYFNVENGKGKEIIEVSGGIFAHNPTDGEMQFPEGYEAGENADGTWGVVEKKVAQIGKVTYPTLAAAVAAAKPGATITLLQDAKGAGVVIDKNLTINFNSFTYTLTEGVGSGTLTSNGFQILKGNKVILKNGTLKVADSAADKFYILIQNYADLTVNKMELDGTNLDKWSKTDGDSYVLSNNSGNVDITNYTKITTNNDGDKAFAFDACDSKYYEQKPVVFVATTVLINGNKIATAAAQEKIEAAVKCGNTYYADLKTAFADAANNKTVTLLSDIKVDSSDVITTPDGLTTLFNVAGKSITLDMNGKTISVDHQSTTDRLYAVISVDDGASLTVTGNGGIDVTTNANTPKVAYMFLKRGAEGTLTIENGTYHMNNSEDSMVYTNSDHVVKVKGGTWTLDAAGTRVNGFPCIFNTKGNGERSIDVSGGTYNTNVALQYWAHEVDIVDAKGNLSYVTKNNDGTWTVTGKPAEVAILTDVAGDYDIKLGYATFKDAIAAIGKGASETTIQLQKDITVKGQFIGHSYAQKVVIDLNGYKMSSTDKTLTVYRGGTEVTIKNGTVHGNTTGGTIQVTYGGKLTLGENVTITSGGSANAIKVDNGTLIIADETVKVLGGKADLVVANVATAKAVISAGYFKKPVDAAWCAEDYIPTEKLENGYYSVKLNAEATVTDKNGNSANFMSLQEAIEAAQTGDTITLNKDISLANVTPVLLDNTYNTYYKVEGKTITIDLNGKTISGEYADATTMLVGLFSTENNGHLTITGKGTVNVTSTKDANVYALIANYEGGCSITVENGTFTLDKAIDSLIYTGADAGENEGVTVKGGTFKLGNVGTGSNGKPWIFNALGANANNVVVNGGSFNADVNHQFWANEVFVPETLALKEANRMWTVVDAVAYITKTATSTGSRARNVGYATLDDAIAAATAGQTITLLKNITLVEALVIPANKTVVLDLNGKTISQTKACTESYEMIANNGTLTITGNGKISFTDTGAGDPNAKWGSYTIRNSGTLVVENGTIEHLGEQNQAGQAFAHTALAIFQYSGSTTINGGTISTPNYRSIRLWSGDVTINGGTFDGQVWVHCVNDSAKLTINGGSFSPNWNDGSSVFVNNSGKKAELSVTGGTFETKIGANDVAALNGPITGGSFKYEPLKALIAEGHLCEHDGTYYVVKKDPAYGMVAKAGDNYYKTLAAAIAAAEDGATITLLTNIAVTKADVVDLDDYYTIFKVDNKTITIDLNGKTISLDAEGMDKMLVGVFSTVNGANLTLTGNGTVEGIANGANVYALVVNYDSTSAITIENGSYTLDAASDCLMYNTNDDKLIIKNGTFRLGNIGSGKNGSPWIFNAKGQNVRSVLVNGGSFNADIQHQFYPFEVQMPETLALKKDENGIYTVVDAVAYVTEREWSSAWYTNNVGYATLEEALKAAEGPKTRSGKTSDQEEVHILSADIKDIVIPEGFEGKLVLANTELSSVTAEGKADIAIVGNVTVNNPNGSAISGKVLNITGEGNLTAIANGDHAYGIGGSDTESITITGITITKVYGGRAGESGTASKYYKDAPEGGAAIGSAYNGAVITLKNVHVVEAVGGSKAAGIGARYHTGVTVNIEKCEIDSVVGGATAAAIGGSRVSGEATENGTNINISGSTITAVGGVYAAGIGSGYDTHCLAKQPLCTINIDGSTINATGGKYAAGVGTGYHNAGLAGEIKNSTVNAVSGEKYYKDAYTQAQDIGFGVVDPAREGKQFNSYLINGDERIILPSVTTASTADELTQAIEGGKTEVALTKDIEVQENTEMLLESNSTLGFNGAGATITTNGTGSSAGESYDYGYVGFIPANGEDATVSNVTVTGSGFVEVGHYGVSTKGDYTIDKLNVKDLVATLAVNNGGNNIAAAFSHYGNATMTNCVMTGTTCEKEGFKAYDAAFVNGTKTTIDNCTFGKVYLAHQAHVTITNTVIDVIDSCAIATRNLGKLTIGAGAKIGTINLIPGSYAPNLVIEEGAEVGAIVYNGVTYTVAEWLAR